MYSKLRMSAALGGFCLSLSTVVSAAQLSLAESPLISAQAVDPNIMVLFDTSGSMQEVLMESTTESPAKTYDSSVTYGASCSGDNEIPIRSGAYYELSVDSDGIAQINYLRSNRNPRLQATYYWGTSGDEDDYRCFRTDRNYSADLVSGDTTNFRPSYPGSYLNWYFSNNAGTASEDFGDSTATRRPGVQMRTEVGKDAITNMIGIATDPDRLQNVRMGLAGFDSTNDIAEFESKLTDINVDANRSALLTAVSNLDADGGTPLASSLASIGRYFVDGHTTELLDSDNDGDRDTDDVTSGVLFANNGPDYGSESAPAANEVMEYSCQKNFVIAVTDGEPTGDANYNSVLATWGDTGTGDDSDDFDDIAKALYDLDLRPTTYPSDTNNIKTYPIGFTINLPMLSRAANYASSTYYQADDATTLGNSLQAIANNVQAQVSTIASVAFNSGRLVTGSSVFQAKFNTANYSGQMLSFVLGSDGSIASTETWEASVELDALSDASALNRNIFTYDNSLANPEGIPFDWDSLNLEQQEDLAYPNNPKSITFTQGGGGSSYPLPTVGATISGSISGASAVVQNIVVQSGLVSSNDAEGYIEISTATNGPFQAGEGILLSSNVVATVDSHPEADGRAVMDFIKGDTSNEGVGTTNYRDRDSRLGDIVNSTPVFVGAPELNWPDYADNNLFGSSSASYSSYKSGAAASRTPVLYVGANDGMLHGFNANVVDSGGAPISGGGAELFAYIPGEVYSSADATSGLHYLANQNYDHKFYVDLTPTVSDVYITNGTTTDWRTVLVGGTRGGGRGLFALDVTNPTRFADPVNNADEVVLWEFTNGKVDGSNAFIPGTGDPEFGYTYAQPSIVMMPNGRWAAVTGNGYNSDSENAYLFIIFLDGGIDGVWNEGTDYIKIQAGTETSNGLSTPRVVDTDGDSVADRVYAGDLRGNMWVFDISASTNITNASTGWRLVSSSPLFTTDVIDNNTTPLDTSDDVRQPITSAPILAENSLVNTTVSNAPNILVFFGTGKFLEPSDANSNVNLQSYYGVWDSGDFNLSRNNLVSRELITETVAVNDPSTSDPNDTVNVRLRSLDASLSSIGISYVSGSDYGWYFDLEDKSSAIATPVALGERVVTDSLLRREVLFFNTIIPNDVACSGGGTGWLMSVDFLTGLAPDFAVFDANNDGTIDSDDQGYIGQEFLEGIPSKSGVLGDYQYTPGSKGSIERREVEVGGGPKEGRLSWEELFRN